MFKWLAIGVQGLILILYFNATAMAAPVVKQECHERRVNKGDVDSGRCKEYQALQETAYRVRKGHVYWIEKTNHENLECAGIGVGAVGNALRPICWTPMGHTRYQVERRTVNYVAPYSKTFKLLKSSAPQLESWQQEQLVDYAMDENYVYYKGQVIERANPARFSLIFPFGNDKKWRFFQLSQSGEYSFVGGVDLGSVDWNKFELIKPAKCPVGNLSCESRDMDDLFGWDFNDGVFGSVGNDVIFLSAQGAARLNGKFSSDAFMFSDRFTIFLFTSGVLYSPSDDKKQLVIADKRKYNNARWFDPRYKPISQPLSGLKDWQKKQLTFWSKTAESVYFNGQYMEGATPDDFAVIFPFERRAGINYSLSKSGGSTFLGAKNIGNVDFDRLKVIVTCDVVDKRLTGQCVSVGQSLSEGTFGTLGDDLIYLDPYKFLRFPNKASSDIGAFSFRSVKYLKINKNFYAVAAGDKEIFKVKPRFDDEGRVVSIDY